MAVNLNWNKLEEIFGIDLRSLALFRICLGIHLILDLATRAIYLEAFYSDNGILPLSFLQQVAGSHLHWYVHTWSGSAAFEGFLLLVQGCIAFLLLVGYKTRLANVASWYLMASLYVRNAPILQGGDLLFFLFLFWSLFVPLEARLSVDAALTPPRRPLPKRILSGGSTAILVQVALVYWFAVIFKWNHDWLSGEATYFALNLDSFASPIGIWVRQYYPLLKLLSWLTLGLELVCPIIVFSPWATPIVRTIGVFLMMLMHLGFALCLELGFFGFTSITGWMLFIPSEVWDKIPERWRTSKMFEALGAWLYAHRRYLWPPRSPPTVRPNLFLQGLPLFLIVYILFWNVRSLDYSRFAPYYPRHFDIVGRTFHIQQMWNMFYIPTRDDGWYVVPAELVDGRTVDLFKNGAKLSWEKPPLISATFIDSRWRKYLLNLMGPDYRRYLEYYARYLCGNWNRHHQGNDRVKALQIVVMQHHNYGPHHIGPTQRRVLWNHSCLETEEPKKQNETVR